MKRILITGMSGTGKSSVVERLAALDHFAVDADSDAWSEWRPMSNPGEPAGVALEPDWVWREDRIQWLLDHEVADALYLSGCSANQGRFYAQLDHVVLLTAPIEVMLDRVATRSSNPFGKTAGEREKIIEDTRVVVPLLRAGADIEIDTSAASLDDVVASIIALSEDDPSGPRA
jgi:shikimate kinase